MDWGSASKSVGGPVQLRTEGEVQLRVLMDHSVVEVFTGSGQALSTRQEPLNPLALYLAVLELLCMYVPCFTYPIVHAPRKLQENDVDARGVGDLTGVVVAGCTGGSAPRAGTRGSFSWRGAGAPA